MAAPARAPRRQFHTTMGTSYTNSVDGPGVLEEVAVKLRQLTGTTMAVGAGYAALVLTNRRWHQHWGATDEEIRRPLPGDELIPKSKLDSTHAITVQAPAERVWPWLTQIGYDGRAGFYSYDALERLIGARKTDQLNPDMRPLAEGDHVPFYPGMPLIVAEVDPPRALVLWQVSSGGKAVDPNGPWGEDYIAWSWAFVLEPADGDATRLLTRMRVDYRPPTKWVPVQLFLEPAHFVMGRRQLLGIRERAERSPAGNSTAAS
jgi:hypothetical protein